MKKKMTLLLAGTVSLVLSACDGGTPPLPKAEDKPVVTTINGKVATPRSAGTVSISDLGVQAPMDANGAFALNLPTSAEMTGKTKSISEAVKGLGCTGNVASTAPNNGYAAGTISVKDSAGSRDMTAVEGKNTGLTTRSVVAWAWLYSEQTATLTGDVDCAKLLGGAVTSVPTKIAISVKPGWNVVEARINASVGLGGLTASGGIGNTEEPSAVTTWRTGDELKAQLGL